MKIRNGFVSNSSSSSFVVAVGQESEVTFTVTADLTRFADDTIVTLQQLEEYIVERYGWRDMDTLQAILEDSSYVKKIYEGAKAAIETGKRVLFGSFSSDGYDDALEQYLCYNGVPDSPGIDVIYSKGGY